VKQFHALYISPVSILFHPIYKPLKAVQYAAFGGYFYCLSDDKEIVCGNRLQHSSWGDCPVVRGIVTKGAFYWLRAPRSSVDLRTDEWILAVIRLLLAVCYLGAFLRPDSIYRFRAYEILAVAYLGYGILIIVALARSGARGRALPPYFHIYIHCLDLIWASQLIGLVHWPTMAFALLFFVMVSTTFRWGFWEAPLTFVIFHALVLLGHYRYRPDAASSWSATGHAHIWMEDLLYIAMVLAIALLAEAKASRSENDFSVRILTEVRTQSGLEGALRIASSEAIQMYGATQILVVMHDKNRNRAMLFRNTGLPKMHAISELDAAHTEPYLFPEPGTSIRLNAARAAGCYRCLALSKGTIGKLTLNDRLPGSFLDAHPFRLLLASAVALEDGWTARVFVVDPRRFFGGMAALRFLRGSVNRVAPVIHDAFMIDRVTTRAKAAAGGQVARELHDGIIQSLTLISMRLESLREQSGADQGSQVDPLKQIQQSIRQEIAALRDFTQHLRSLELDSGNLLSFMACMTVKFEVEHGIPTRFVSEGLEEVRLTPHKCVELARITQEALANIRKHSDAKEALVMLRRRNGHYVLSIIDNGRGFRFSGHRSHGELRSSGEGPLVLMDRAQAIGGTVSVESIENSGSRVEVVIPIA
jgi:two-component sensor histidine kinase